MKISIALLMLIPGLAVGGPSVPQTSELEIFASRAAPQIWSLSGTESVDRASSLTYIGEKNSYAQAPGGHFGEYVWTGDLNGDGFADLGVSAPQLNGTNDAERAGRFYVFYGSGSSTRGSVDLSLSEPDLIIKGGRAQCGLLDSFAIGDIDGDDLVDLILGVPIQPSCGRVYVLWGKGPWAGTQTLVDPGQLSPDGPTGGYGFLNTNDYSIIAGDLAPVPAPSDNYEVGRVVRCDDLDEDGYDDLVFATPGWNKVNVVWGGQSRSSFGNELTIIDDSVDFGRFGDCVEIGDINGNGLLDMVATSPLRNDGTTGSAQAGSAFVILDVGRIRGNDTVVTNDPGLVKPMITGNDPYDRFGTTLTLRDINGDQKDDIIVSAPQSDGFLEDSDGAGSIHVFLGAQANQFPSMMDSESGAEWIIYGQMKDQGDYPGDQLGSAFSLPDFDGDTRPDLVIGYPDRDNGTDEKAGSVFGYPSSRIFTSANKNIEIKDVTERFAIKGIDPLDRIGYRLAFADWDGDGAEDMYVSSPASDGPNNERKECGALHLVYGISISMEKFWLSGPGLVGGKVACGYGTVNLNMNISSNLGTAGIDEMTVSIPKVGASMTFQFSDGSIPTVDSKFGMLKNAGGISLTWVGSKGTLTIPATFEWWFPEGIFDIVVKADPFNRTRTYAQLISTVNSVVLEGPGSIGKNGKAIAHTDAWFGIGDELNISGFVISYDGIGKFPCRDDAPFRLRFSDSGSFLGEAPLGEMCYLIAKLSNSGTRNISVVLIADQSKFPSGLPVKYLPVMPKAIDISLRVDGEVPGGVEGLRILPDQSEGEFDDDGSWNLTWNASWLTGDSQSGLQYYEYYDTADPSNRTPAMSMGGLFGTYYNDDRFLSPAQVRVDKKMEFDWGRFPPLTEIVPEGYSIRWHGWLSGPEHGKTRFTLSGQGGSACMYLSGEELLPWGDLTIRKISRYVDLTEDEIVPVEVYFKQSGKDEVAFNLRWEDVAGDPVQIPKRSMFHPSNATEVYVDKSGPFQVAVSAVDWVGLRSVGTEAGGIIDETPPVFNLTEFRPWFNSTDARIRFFCSDPGSISGLGSGIDPESISYRFRESWMKEFGPWKKDDVWSVVRNGESYDVTIRSDLDSRFRGFIQMRASDMVGNIADSAPMSLGVDIVGPEFSVVEPSLLVHHEGSLVSFYVRVMDADGSGVDGSSMRFRSRTNGSEWSDWSDIGKDSGGSEVAAEFQRELPARWNTIQFLASDMVGNIGLSEEYDLVVKPNVVDHPPVAVISSPVNGSSYIVGTPVFMDGSKSQDDGIGKFDKLRYTWSSNQSGYLGSGKSISTNRLGEGLHRITLYVDDGTPGHNITTSVEVRIKPVKDPVDKNSTDDGNDKKPYLLYLGIAATILFVTIIIILAVVVARRQSKVEEEEVKIEYRVSSTSDIEYDERSAEEERAIGLDIGPAPPQDLDEERRRLYGEE